METAFLEFLFGNAEKGTYNKGYVENGKKINITMWGLGYFIANQKAQGSLVLVCSKISSSILLIEYKYYKVYFSSGGSIQSDPQSWKYSEMSSRLSSNDSLNSTVCPRSLDPFYSNYMK